MHQTTRDRRDQRGNILFLILLAIVLFSALANAVMRSMQDGGKDGSDENASLAAGTILNQAGLMEQAVQRFLLSNNCRDYEFDFTSSVHTYTAHPSVTWPSDNRCDLFNPSGAGLSYPSPSESWLDPALKSGSTATLWGKWYFQGFACINNIGTGSSPNCATGGSGTAELIAILPYVTKQVCQAINNTIPIAEVNGNPVGGFNSNGVNDTGAARFDGRYLTGARFSDSQTGHRYGCYDRGTGVYAQAYIFYYVLLAR